MSLEQLTLIERPYPDLPHTPADRLFLGTGELLLRTNVVVGVELRERPDIYLKGYACEGCETRRVLPLVASHARRWTEFYTSHFAGNADHAHSSEAIIRYVLGIGKTALHGRPIWHPLTYQQADCQSIEAGKGYAILDDEGHAMHFLYGIERPNLTISSPVPDQPPIVTPADAMLELYGGEQLCEITGEQKPSLFRP